jgi:hypothetical protein
MDHSIPYSQNSLSNPTPTFTGMYNSEQNTYIAFYDGYVKGYNSGGNQIYAAMANSNYHVEHFCMNSNYMVAEEKENILSGSDILVTFYPSGAGKQQTALSQDVVAMCEKDADNVFVFGNTTTQGVIQLFDRINNNLWNPYPGSLPSGSILSAVKIDDDTYLIGYSNGTIYKYRYSTSSVTAWTSGYTAVQMRYDFDNNEVFVFEANKITSLSYLSTLPHRTILSSGTITDGELIYNR